MTDVFHTWGSDFELGPSGDLALASGVPLSQQRILRRLLTNPGDYIWQLDYGAGLRQFLGTPASPVHIQAIVRSQIFKETAVARTPEPKIDATYLSGAGTGQVGLTIQYWDNSSDSTQTLSLAVNGGVQ